MGRVKIASKMRSELGISRIKAKCSVDFHTITIIE